MQCTVGWSAAHEFSEEEGEEGEDDEGEVEDDVSHAGVASDEEVSGGENGKEQSSEGVLHG